MTRRTSLFGGLGNCVEELLATETILTENCEFNMKMRFLQFSLFKKLLSISASFTISLFVSDYLMDSSEPIQR